MYEPEIKLTIDAIAQEKAPYFAQMIETCHPVSETVEYQPNRELFR